jgi:pimeloyl-ACP methyl ester carboxylesterase
MSESAQTDRAPPSSSFMVDSPTDQVGARPPRTCGRRGYNVLAPQLPETSLADDVARVRQVLAWLDGPAVVVGHSYGGQVITALGGNAGNVVGLVYIAAFALDDGETINGVTATTHLRARWRT